MFKTLRSILKNDDMRSIVTLMQNLKYNRDL